MNDGLLESVLSAQPRRVVRALRDHESRDAGPILRRDETLECGEYVTLVYELHHVLLPALEDDGLVEFDRRRDAVTRGSKFDEKSQAIDQTDDERGVLRDGHHNRE